MGNDDCVASAALTALQWKDNDIARLTAEAANWQDALNRMSDQLDEAWGERDAARKVIGKVREYLDEKVKGPSFPFFPHVVKDIKALLAEEK